MILYFQFETAFCEYETQVSYIIIIFSPKKNY